MEKMRQTVVDMLNVLGAPRECTESCCDGCEFERMEATLQGLEALGYLRTWFEKTGEHKNPAGGTCIEAVQHMDPEDPLDAWEAFMRGELGITLADGWKTLGTADRLKSGQEGGEA